MTTSSIRDVLRELSGVKCEGADNPHGSVIRFDLGELGLGPKQDATDVAHGWRHLTVLSPWRIQTPTLILGDWNADDISPVLRERVGKRVEAAESAPPGWDLRIKWEDGVELLVFGDATIDRDDAWFILGTDGLEISGSPEFEATPLEPNV